MSGKRKIIRTLRCKNQKMVGVLSKLIGTISSFGADIGDIKTVRFGEMFNFRDISIVVDDENHLSSIVKTIRKIPGVHIESIIDDVLEMHRGGKIVTQGTQRIDSIEELRKVYTPGVASVCNIIFRDPKEAETYTSIGKNVALITNGSRVLGLGNIGPQASMPVMEGKSALFNQFTGLNMIPILLETRDTDKFIETVLNIAPTFSAIQLEDISAPHCFAIEDALIEKLDMPIMHDDQHGTATVVLSAVINACRITGKNIHQIKVGQLGLGASGAAIAHLIAHYSGNPVMGADLSETAKERFENAGGILSDMDSILKECDLIVATTGRGGLIKPDMVKKGSIIFACSNPEPEITSEDAVGAGAAFSSDGSRINNLLGYPGIFKGALEAKATCINKEMLIAAAEALVAITPQGDVIPDILDPEVHNAVAKSVMKAAVNSKVTRDFN